MRVTPGSLARLVAHGHPGAELLGEQLLGTAHDYGVPRRERCAHQKAAGSRTIRPDPHPPEPTGPAREKRPGEPVPLDDGASGTTTPRLPAPGSGTRHEHDRTGSAPGQLRSAR